MIQLYALVALGGAIGSMGRYALSAAALRLVGVGFPWGTLVINVLGSLLIGWLAAAALHGRLAPQWATFGMVGLCGGFTTFSSFSLQTFELLRNDRLWEALANVVLSVLLCVAAAAFGYVLRR